MNTEYKFNESDRVIVGLNNDYLFYNRYKLSSGSIGVVIQRYSTVSGFIYYIVRVPMCGDNDTCYNEYVVPEEDLDLIGE